MATLATLYDFLPLLLHCLFCRWSIPHLYRSSSITMITRGDNDGKQVYQGDLMKRPRHEDAQGSESLPVEVQDTKPVTSRVRKGGLSLLPIISLDVLFDLKHYLSQQIVRFLELLDLLDLARTSKAF
ncbi:hypothetical protein BDR06DRAFT_1037550 [Suillus hirtellus]|nr:hypothetical protein BDR06DRAFT_1037550 [Suillus hirtellus]